MPLILWSGGCDSTYLLHTALRTWYDHQERANQQLPGTTPHTTPPNIPVRTITIIHPQVPAQNEQRRARHALTTALNKQGYHWPHLEVTITHTTPNNQEADPEADPEADHGVTGAGDYGGLIQPLLWIPLAIPYLDHHEDLAVGYIKGDDAQFYLTTIRTAFNNLQWIAGRAGNLSTPLDNTSKPEIIHHLKTTKLYKHTWWCEDPTTNKPCKKCAPCMTHATALWQLNSGNAYHVQTYGLNKTNTTNALNKAKITNPIPPHTTQPPPQ